MDDKMKILRKLLDKLSFPGICGFLVVPHGDNDVQVIAQLDLEWLKLIRSRPEHIAHGMRLNVKKRLESYLGFEVIVGSILVDKCN